MASKLKPIADQYGLSYLPRSKDLPWETAVGSYRGFEVNVLLVVGQTLSYTVTFSARPQDNNPAETPAAFLARFAEEQKKIVQAATAQGCTLQVTLRPSSFKKVPERIGVVLDTVTGYLGANGFVSCCDRCGSTGERHLCAVSSLGCRSLCPECQQRTAGDMENQKSQARAKKGNLVTGLVGAFLGSIIGVIVWMLIYQLGYISALGGLVMAVCVLKGYELFGGKLDVGGTIACVALSVAMLFLAHYGSYSLELYKVLADEGMPVSFFDCFQLLPQLFEDQQLLTSFVGELLIGYLLMALGAFSAVRNAFRSSNPNGTVVRVQE